MNSCTKEAVESAANHCSYIIENCPEQNFIQFISIFYCHLDESIPFLVFFTVNTYKSPPISYYFLYPQIPSYFIYKIIGFFFAFHFLSSTAENYLTPSISKIAKTLRLSEILAGVTLLAFSNGASDIITSFTAGGDDVEGISLAIGGIFGASLFSTMIVLSRVIMVSDNEIQVELIFFWGGGV